MATLEKTALAPAAKPYQPPIVGPGNTAGTVTDKIADVILTKSTPKWWLLGTTVAFGLLMMFLTAVTWLFYKGVGIWGVNWPIGWGFAIINFVWWIGIGHAGTLISAILLLFRQEWRTSINRFAEAMTLFAVACAGMFPVLHLGRPWLFYWLLPYPNTMTLWPQFRSPLIWDVFAVTTYATVSAMFWFVGLIPDLATMRDKAKNKAARLLYGAGSLGWRGSARHWHNYETAYLLLAGLSTPLVLSVHTVVSFDFSIGIIPGWHATIFPPYFVAGAIYAGFAMVLLLAIPLRVAFGWKDFITDRHLENMGKVMLATSLIVFYGYVMELFFAWYSADTYERFLAFNRVYGPYHIYWYALIFCNGLTPQLLWFRKIRTSPLGLFLISLIVSVGMWLERFVIVVTSLTRDFLPASWGVYKGTIWDWATFIGTLGLFSTLFFLFIRILPAISIFEMRTIVPNHGDAGDEMTEVV
jgi:molybdopterin-containing oxidoreductase family membrane subunit